jgi:rare lipoprotein A
MKKLLPIIFILSLSSIVFSAEFGIASWYGGKFHGRKTSSGEIYDMNRLTAAHKSIPFGTIVLVTNLENDKSVRVKVNDRGPFVSGRIIDLSKAAAIEIGLIKTGVARVKIEILEESTASDNQATYDIQVASFREEANAKRMKDTLDALSVESVFEVTSGGIIRVVVPNVLRAKLAGAGCSKKITYSEILVVIIDYSSQSRLSDNLSLTTIF